MRPGEVRAQFVSKDGREVTVRGLRRGDLGALVRFANAISREKRSNPDLGITSLDGRATRKGEGRFLANILREAKKRNVVSRAAFVDGEIVGHSDVWRRIPRDVHHTGVFGIVLLDGCRGAGIGGRLMSEVLRESKRVGIWLVELTVFAINERAIHLYEKQGFMRVGVVPDHIVRGERHIDEIIMYADLRKR
ncbi:MAG: GNAT family N-acetyltransferase [Nitrososphaerota archaeon]|nr:GNAT family N-acetyltransferase [Nitrososphaerota archaeon]